MFAAGGHQILPHLRSEEVTFCAVEAAELDSWEQNLNRKCSLLLQSRHVVEARRQFAETKLAVANVDTLTAALVLQNACALNFANAEHPGLQMHSWCAGVYAF